MNNAIRVAGVLGWLALASACAVNDSPALPKAGKQVVLSDVYGICAMGADELMQDIGRRGIDSDFGTLRTDSAKVSYEVGYGPQVDHARGKRTELPALTRGEVTTYLWEDPEISAFVVEGLRERKRPSQTPVEIWMSFERSDSNSKALAESLAATTANCR